MSDIDSASGMYGWSQVYLDQIERQKRAEAKAAREAYQIKIGLAAPRSWGDKTVEAVNKAMRTVRR